MQRVRDGHGATRAVHVGRQPIYDVRDAVVAYELLFREDAAATASMRSDASATIDVIINTFSEFGLADIVDDKQCFVNVTRDFILGDLPLPFGPEQTVLEILETVAVDQRLVEGAERLVADGYRIALDDFVPGSPHDALLPLATVVKLDLLGTPPEQLRAAVAACAAYPEITLLAEKVETPDHMALAQELGCRLFQGYALSRPTVVSGQTLSPSRLYQVELLTSLSRAEIDMPQIVSLVSRDAAVSMRLLRVINSAGTGLSHRVSSVRQAVTLLGTRRIREWVALMVLGTLAGGASTSQLSTAVARARMCQHVAEHTEVDGDVAFTAGLLVGIADLLNTPVPDLVAGLPLSDDLAAPLVRDEGRLAEVIRAVLAYERADLEEVRRAQLAPAWLVQAYLSAAGWSTRAVDTIVRGG
jgi:EAL and modified HD-GYP domain-containing signal transduction protein